MKKYPWDLDDQPEQEPKKHDLSSKIDYSTPHQEAHADLRREALNYINDTSWRNSREINGD